MSSTPTGKESSQYTIGQKVVAQQRGCDIWRNAIVHDMMTRDGATQYYVHWTEHNRRLDEWVDPDRIRNVQQVAKKRTNALQDPLLSQSPQMTTRRRSGAPLDPMTPSNEDAKRAKLAQNHDVRFDERPKNVSQVHIGSWTLEPWYYSPYPRLVAITSDKNADPYDNDPMPVWGFNALAMSLPEIYICEFCLAVFISPQELDVHHAPRCIRRCPPGTEIYRDINQCVLLFEVDGLVQRHYCERLSLLSRLFLEHKCVDWDMTPFLFYVLTQFDEGGCHIVGYFAKEKNSPDEYNLACILVLPPYQCRGFGRLLIEVSYALSRRQGRCGTPERPLSDLGARTYHSFWRDTLLDILLLQDAMDGFEVTLQGLMTETGMCLKDIVDTLRSVHVMDKAGSSKLYITEDVQREHLRRKARRKLREKEHVLFDPCLLRWDAENYEMRKVSDTEFEVMTTVVGMVATGDSWAQPVSRN